MPLRGWIYVWTVLVFGLGLLILSFFGYQQIQDNWLAFAVLTLLATIAQLVEADGTTHQSYYPHHVFFFAGAVLLPFALIVPLIAIPHLIEWAKKSLTDKKNLKNWYLQPFNIATFIIATGTVHLLYEWLKDNAELFNSPARVFLVFGIAALYILINSLMVAIALWLARGLSFAKSGIFTIESLMPEIILANLGYGVAVLWLIDAWLILTVLSPIIILYEALKIPQLRQEAQTDPKTNLLNSRYFDRNFSQELERASRFNRPLTLIMADLDLMRNINNTYGHLAGDAVLVEIAHIIRNNLRQFDLAGRFGGEEFAIALPEVRSPEALILAERLRATIAAHPFILPNHAEPIQVTMSFGFASFPQHAKAKEELFHAADIAVYYAKSAGRNRVMSFDQVPSEVRQEYLTTKTHLKSDEVTDLVSEPNTRNDLEQDLCQALANDELKLFYQPQLNLQNYPLLPRK
jgi:diguanylate cyclase (GGDEF)-like protein